ncbi:mannonate dehydratase [Halostagnicola sp. A-GB9-2]|uniref:mannonate dehydratase n=1 Tax=Halostagnicola sp. A-GB9-2 TaxID=3048066 RepID=UPI0024BF5833|nr:mannonate dehydratase [Halostagnicola sp. A-GB9-2]MDJ1434629.1 mannonate dehydratase [Halostagnicola sp. A-GB9-2]
MDLALTLPPTTDDRWEIAAQMGVTNAVVHTLEIGDGRRPTDYDTLLRWKNRFEHAGIDLSVIEGSVPLTDTTRLGKPGRDEEIDDFCRFLRNLGRLDVPVVCYDWMAGIRWARTATSVPSRGGSLTTAYDNEQMSRGPKPDIPPITAEELWANLEYFLERVVPVAEEAGVKLGLHPDDPPREEVRGVPRIINSVEAYERALDIVDSEHNGVTFCQGNFAAMGVDVPSAIRRLGDRINFVHFRDVEGDADGFVETWHDDGPTDMLAAMEAYEDIGFDGPARPDHVPTMAGETNENPGYETMGRLFAIGYMKGLLEQVGNDNR